LTGNETLATLNNLVFYKLVAA